MYSNKYLPMPSSMDKVDKFVCELDFDIQLGVPSWQNVLTSLSPYAEAVEEILGNAKALDDEAMEFMLSGP